LIWPLAFAAMDETAPAAFRAWPHVKFDDPMYDEAVVRAGEKRLAL